MAKKSGGNQQHPSPKQRPAPVVRPKEPDETNTDKRGTRDPLEHDRPPSEKRWKDISLHDRYIIVLTGLAILVAIFGGGIYYLQWQTANATLLLLEAEHTESRRPHIVVTDFRICDLSSGDCEKSRQPEKGSAVAVNIVFKNTGGSTAYGVTSKRHLLFGGSIRGNVHSDTFRGLATEFLEPDIARATTAVSINDTFSNQTAGGSDDLVPWQGESPILVFGEILYTDSTEKPRYCTPFIVQILSGLPTWKVPNWKVIETYPETENGQQITHTVNDLCPTGFSR